MFIPSHISYDQWRIAICVHAFYPELMPDIILCVRNFLAVCGNDNVHVFLTIPEEHPFVPDLDCCSHLAVMAVPNRGYDIAPFFHTLNNLDLNDYDYIVKLHTKRDVDCFVNFRLLKGAEFRSACLSFCSSVDAIKRSLSVLALQQDVGMVAGARVIDPSGYGTCRNPWKNARQITAIGLKPTRYSMVLGSMFMVRSHLLRKVWRRFTWEDFLVITIENAHKQYGLATDWEGAFGMLVVAQGFRISDGRHSAIVSKVFDFVKGLAFSTLRSCMTLTRRVGLSKAIDCAANVSVYFHNRRQNGRRTDSS